MTFVEIFAKELKAKQWKWNINWYFPMP